MATDAAPTRALSALDASHLYLVQDDDLAGGGLDGVKLGDDAVELDLDVLAGREVRGRRGHRPVALLPEDDGRVRHADPGVCVARVRLDLALDADVAQGDVRDGRRDERDLAANVDAAGRGGGRIAGPAVGIIAAAGEDRQG